MNSKTLTFYMQTMSAITCLPFLVAGYPESPNPRHSPLELAWYCEIILGGAPLMIATTRAFQIGPPTKVTSLFMTTMLLSGVIGITFLSEKISCSSGVGSVIILISVLIVTMQQKKKVQPCHSNLEEAEYLRPTSDGS